MAGGTSPNAMYVPLSDVAVKSNRRRSSSSFCTMGGSRYFESLPAITAQPAAEAQRHLIRKIKQCCVTFNFGLADEAVEAKEAKRETLLEIVHYVVAFPNCLTAQVYQEISNMVEINVYRPLPPKMNPVGDEQLDPEDATETVDDLAWPHLHIVYELMLQVLESPNFSKKAAKAAFSESFALHLLQMFESEDTRERDFLKMTVHKMYRMFLHLRTYMREQIGYLLQEYVARPHERGFCGVFEMLEILGSIVEGFATPLKEDHVHYLNHVLLPLAKMPGFVVYHSPLLYCFLQYTVKKPALAALILRYLFRHWPVQTARKQVLMLNAVEHLVSTLDEQEMGRSVGPLLFANLATMLRTPHFQVADRCLGLLQTLKVKEYIRRNSAAVIAVIYPVVVGIARGHWNEGLQKTAFDLQKWFRMLNASATGQIDCDAVATAAPAAAAAADASSPWGRMFALEKPAARPAALSKSRSNLDPHMTQMLAKYNVGTKMEGCKENKKNAL